MINKFELNDVDLSESSEDETQELLSIIDTRFNKLLYANLTGVNQDNFLILEQYKQGLASYGFSTCYAVIAQNKKNPLKTALAHVSGIDPLSFDFFKDMIASVGAEDEVILTLARSRAGYTKQYEDEIDEDTDNLPPNEYFKKYDKEHLLYFIKYFRQCDINMGYVLSNLSMEDFEQLQQLLDSIQNATTANYRVTSFSFKEIKRMKTILDVTEDGKNISKKFVLCPLSEMKHSCIVVDSHGHINCLSEYPVDTIELLSIDQSDNEEYESETQVDTSGLSSSSMFVKKRKLEGNEVVSVDKKQAIESITTAFSK